MKNDPFNCLPCGTMEPGGSCGCSGGGDCGCGGSCGGGCGGNCGSGGPSGATHGLGDFDGDSSLMGGAYQESGGIGRRGGEGEWEGRRRRCCCVNVQGGAGGRLVWKCGWELPNDQISVLGEVLNCEFGTHRSAGGSCEYDPEWLEKVVFDVSEGTDCCQVNGEEVCGRFIGNGLVQAGFNVGGAVYGGYAGRSMGRTSTLTPIWMALDTYQCDRECCMVDGVEKCGTLEDGYVWLDGGEIKLPCDKDKCGTAKFLSASAMSVAWYPGVAGARGQRDWLGRVLEAQTPPPARLRNRYDLDFLQVKQINDVTLTLCCNNNNKVVEYGIWQFIYDGTSFWPIDYPIPATLERTGHYTGRRRAPSGIEAHFYDLRTGGRACRRNRDHSARPYDPWRGDTATLSGYAEDCSGEYDCVEARGEASSRMAWVADVGAQVLGMDFANVESDVSIILCCDGTTRYSMGGSYYPVFGAYIDVGGYQLEGMRPSSNFARFSQGEAGRATWFRWP